MFNREKIRVLQIRLNSAYMITDLDMSDHQRRDLVTELREIATELDCLKPVEREFPGDFAEGMKAMDQELLDNAMVGRGVCANDIVFEDRDIPAAFPGRTDASLGHDHGSIPAAPGPDYATRKDLDAAVRTLNGTDLVDRNAVLALTDRVELIEKALAAVEPDDPCELSEWQRQHLYNQAYLAALPAVIKAGYQTASCAGLANQIATQSMEYLK